ncbi:uncharacterized protein A1O5_01350 [Cladophialophora psammophila CBS 110553]|uniref:Uncharacterized protein n=1 Tax=Cladophialophora psammophila CBS 110553 TaxID=1182543 RepID=W9X2F0_9EURO|nr:uncharacterized protein A1O5_01350 [Cladophialophora psammophila CBS 110553]EXJ74657.1 hypothetical protein A1O5_01350 [Cladophialophora psammophila CBS 110553]
MIFPQGDVLLQRSLEFGYIKPRLLGHSGTCPGLTLVLVGQVPPHCSQDTQGLYNLVSKFSTTGGGFPSHINAETPGAIHEGGELGYALSVSFGAVMDIPDLIVCFIVGPVLVGNGAEWTFKVTAAADLLRSKMPDLRVRVVNATDLIIMGASSSYPRALTDNGFDALFTEDAPIHFKEERKARVEITRGHEQVDGNDQQDAE